jgi:hypothetical protein
MLVIAGTATMNVLDRLVSVRGSTPGFICCDKGAELTTNPLRDGCRFTQAGSGYMELCSPRAEPVCRDLS